MVSSDPTPAADSSSDIPIGSKAVSGIDPGTEASGAPGHVNEPIEPQAARCTWHPDRETLLRCTRCNKPMCTQCAHQHPVGMRCRECFRELRSPLYKVSPLQYLGACAASAAASALAAMALGYASAYFCWLAFFLAYAAGNMVADAASWGAGRKRGRGVAIAAAVGLLVGVGLVELLMNIGPLRQILAGMGLRGFNDLGLLILLVIGIPSAMRRLR
jgi:hypothetical protein